MKLGLKMDGKENYSMLMSPESIIRPTSPKRCFFAAILGLLVIVLIAGATVLGIFVGKKMTKETYKESWVTYHDTNTDTVIRERYIVQDQEVYITKPGEVGMIYDYGKNQIVMNVDRMKADNDDACLCMVFDFDKTNAMSLDEVVSFLNQTYIYQSGNFMMERMMLEKTGTDLDILNLSRKSKEMCLGCIISEMNVKKRTDLKESHTRRKKREISIKICIWMICFTIRF